MKRLKFITASILMIFFAAGSAHSLSYSYRDTFLPTDSGKGNYLNTGQYISWIFDITDLGFAPGEQIVESASVSLSVVDDEDDSAWNFLTWEAALFRAGNGLPAIWEVDTGLYNFSISQVTGLESTGTMTATLKAIGGDFYFKSATLFADATDFSDATHPVPEPATMLLFGMGLVGLAGVARRRKNLVKHN